MKKNRSPRPDSALQDEEFSPAPPPVDNSAGSQVVREIQKPAAAVKRRIRKIAKKIPAPRVSAMSLPVYHGRGKVQNGGSSPPADLSTVPTSLESAFSGYDEQKKQAEVLGSLLGTDKDIYAILEKTDLTQYEVDTVPDGLWLAENGIGGELKQAIPELRDWILKKARARVSLNRGSRTEFVDAWKPSLDALRKEWEAEQRKKERLMGG